MELSEYQKEGINWMLKREQAEIAGGVQSDEVGLGKTIMTIQTINKNPKNATLIIVPKSLLFQWKHEINKWKTNISLVDIKTFISEINSKPQIVLASVSNFTKAFTIYHKIKWDRIVLDEAHSIKNKRSKTHISICELHGSIKWALTATPVLNKMNDFWSIMKWIGADMEEVFTKKEDIVNKFFLRRTQEKLNLPGFDVHIIKTKLHKQEEFLYNNIEDNIKTLIKNQANKLYVLEKLMRLIQICVHPQLFSIAMARKHNTLVEEWKYDASKLEALTILLKTKQKTIIFCKFVEEMKMYKSLFPNSILIQGCMKEEQRNDAITTFKTKNVPFLFIQEKIGSCGLNLENAKRVIFTSPNWSPALEYQAIGRANRRGQTDRVQVYKLITEGTIEEHIIKIQENKNDVFQSLWESYQVS